MIGVTATKTTAMELSEAPQPQPPSGSPAAAASYPPWVLLECRCSAAGDEDDGGDAWTAAACRTSAGDPIRASVRVAAPPAESQVCLQVKDRSYAVVVAAHGDSVLIAVGFNQYERQPEYFVYSAGAGAARPPSIYLLPPCHCYHDEESAGSRRSDSPRYLHPDATGLIVRPGGDDGDGLVVAPLTVVSASDDDWSTPKAAELLLLRRGRGLAADAAAAPDVLV